MKKQIAFSVLGLLLLVAAIYGTRDLVREFHEALRLLNGGGVIRVEVLSCKMMLPARFLGTLILTLPPLLVVGAVWALLAAVRSGKRQKAT